MIYGVGLPGSLAPWWRLSWSREGTVIADSEIYRTIIPLLHGQFFQLNFIEIERNGQTGRQLNDYVLIESYKLR